LLVASCLAFALSLMLQRPTLPLPAKA